jgi:hypothetical protein
MDNELKVKEWLSNLIVNGNETDKVNAQFTLDYITNLEENLDNTWDAFENTRDNQ